MISSDYKDYLLSDQDFENVMKTINFKSDYMYFLKTKSKDFEMYWKIIHEMHTETSSNQLYIFFKILNNMKDCACSKSAFEYFIGLLNFDITSFHNENNFKDFWILFHNKVNLKLQKKIFVDYQH